jgi:hypothetical protein
MGLTNLWNKAKLYRLYEKACDNPELLKDKEFWIEIFKTAWNIEGIRNMLKGFKTYIVAALAAAVTVAHMLGYLNDSAFQSLMALLGSGAIMTVAAKLNRASAQATTDFENRNNISSEQIPTTK